MSRTCDAFIAACAALVKPGGLLFVATINRTPKAFALAIVGAEYVLRWLPRGTHDYAKLVRPAELEAALAGGRARGRSTGPASSTIRSPTAGRASTDMDVNYMIVAEKREARRAQLSRHCLAAPFAPKRTPSLRGCRPAFRFAGFEP